MKVSQNPDSYNKSDLPILYEEMKIRLKDKVSP